MDPSKHAELNQAKFDAWAPTYEQKRYDFFRRMQERVLDRLDLGEGMSLLDIGCGTGWAVRKAASVVGSRGKACGVDLSQKMIENAQRAARGIPNVEFRQANAETLPFPDRSFDRVMCTMSFHHYLNPSGAVKEMARVLKPEGRLCIVDPTADNFFMRWVDACIRSREPDHVRMYSSREFQELFESAGLHGAGSGRILVPWLTAKAHFAERS